MWDLLNHHEFWTAVTNLAWPAIVVFAIYRFLPTIESLLRRDSVTVKVAGFELTSQQIVEDIRSSISDLQKRLSEIEIDKGILENRQIESVEVVKKPSLLWVDDYPSNNAFLIESLAKEGIEVVMSLSTDDAMRQLGVAEFSAIVTDLGRKEAGVDNPNAGFDLLRRLREANNPIPVLVYAGPRGLANRKRLLASGAEDVTTSGVTVFSFVKKHILKA